MKRLTPLHFRAVRGFIEVWLQILLGSTQATVTGGIAWYVWRAGIELPKAQAALQASGYSLDVMQACPPEMPDAGNFGAVELLKGIATREEDLTPELQSRIAAIKALNVSARKGGSALTEEQMRQLREGKLNGKELEKLLPKGKEPGTKKKLTSAPELLADKPHEWSAWREWIAEGLQWEVPAEKNDAKAVLIALRMKTAAMLPRLVEAARKRTHSSAIPSQRSRTAASIQRGDVVLDFGAYQGRLMPLARILAMQCEAALAAEEEKEAEDLATVLIALRDLAGSDISLISYLVRVTFDRMLLDFAQRNIAAGRMNVWFLMQWPAIFNSDNETENFQRSMIMERASSNYMLEQVVRQKHTLDSVTSFSGLAHIVEKKGQGNPVAQRVAQVTFDLTRAAVIRDFIQEMDALKSGGLMGYYRHMKAFDDPSGPDWLDMLQPHKLLLSGMRAGYGVLLPGMIHTAMRRRMVPAICALERHRLAGGAPPDSLAVLPKHLLAAIPKDLDGQPIRYRRDKDGWVLWSVGLDLKDDWKGKAASPQDTGLAKDALWKLSDWQWRWSPP